MASTFSSCAIARADLPVSGDGVTAPVAITDSDRMRPRSVVTASVSPSAYQAPQDRFVMNTPPDAQRATRPRDRRVQIARRFALLHQRARGGRRRPAKVAARIFEPALELPGTRDEEAVEQIAPIELERGAELTGRDGAIERDDVAPDPLGIE